MGADKINTTDLGQLYWFKAGPVTVHNDWEAITSNERWKNGDGPLPLLRLLFSEPNLDLAVSIQRGTVDKQYFNWILDGKVTFGTDVTVPDSKLYFSQLESLMQPYNLGVNGTIFGNTKMISSGKRALAAVSLHDDCIMTTNQRTMQYGGKKFDDYSLVIKPPLLKTLTESGEKYAYFRGSLQAQVLSVLALAQSMGAEVSDTQRHVLVTADGVTYEYDEDAASAEPIRDRISLSSSTPKVSEATISLDTKEDVVDIFSVRADTNDKVGIEDIAGPEFVREKLMELVLAQRDPKALEKWGVRKPHGLLLYGPAGTGKSMAAEALAKELDADLWEIKASDITDKWLGNTEKNMQALFDKAKKATKPTVMFWDEIDSLVGKTDGEGSGARALEAARGIFKREVAQLGETAPNVVLVGATNHPDDIDEALVRAGRFDMKIYMGLPEESTRVQLFASRIADVMQRHETDEKKLYDTDLNISRLAELTDEWSGAEIVEVLRRAQMKKAIDEIRGRKPTPISQNDIELEIQLFRHER